MQSACKWTQLCVKTMSRIRPLRGFPKECSSSLEYTADECVVCLLYQLFGSHVRFPHQNTNDAHTARRVTCAIILLSACRNTTFWRSLLSSVCVLNERFLGEFWRGRRAPNVHRNVNNELGCFDSIIIEYVSKVWSFVTPTNCSDKECVDSDRCILFIVQPDFWRGPFDAAASLE
jgi:hypothetical protein